LLLLIKALYLGSRERDEFALIINTHALLTIIRVVGSHAKIPIKNAIRIETYNRKPTDKNKIGVKLAILGTKDSARHKRTLLSERKH